MTAQVMEPQRATSSRVLAAEFRAEIARRGLTAAQVARQHGIGEMWLSRRIGRSATAELSLEDVELIARLLEIPLSKVAELWVDAAKGTSHPSAGAPQTLPRLDSNQQPSGYLFPLVSAVAA